MTNEDLFIHTLDDLREKIERNTKYDYMRATALLRQLLIDTPTLMDLANEKYRLKIYFTIRDEKEPTGFTYLRIEQFLKKIVFRYNFVHGFHVQGIIKTVSDKLGGVHITQPTDFQQIILKELNNIETRKFNDIEFKPPLMATIALIANYTLAALKPLEVAIKGHTPAGGFKPQS